MAVQRIAFISRHLVDCLEKFHDAKEDVELMCDLNMVYQLSIYRY